MFKVTLKMFCMKIKLLYYSIADKKGKKKNSDQTTILIKKI